MQDPSKLCIFFGFLTDISKSELHLHRTIYTLKIIADDLPPKK